MPVVYGNGGREQGAAGGMVGDGDRGGNGMTDGGIPIVMVNHCHPDMPHVCATRLRQFAEALARRNNRVVLLAAGSEALGASPPARTVATELETHDWSRPYVLACMPRRRPMLERAREGRCPAVLGRGLLAGQYAFRGGVFDDWTAGTRPYWRVLAEKFAPRVVWATFGNTDAWRIARGIARHSGCPWVMDLKDSWESFIPSVLRRSLARRFSGAAAATALSQAHALEVDRWFQRPAEVVYSGFPTTLSAGADAPIDEGTVRLTVVGSLYGRPHLDAMIAGIAAWLARRRAGNASPDVVVAYLGSEGGVFRAAAAGLAGRCRVETPGTVPLSDMLAILRRARANLFLRNDRVLFHHKIFEMLAADRPIICLPEECDEAKGIVRGVGGKLFSCGTADDVRTALDRIEAGPLGPSGVSREALERYSWEGQAVTLERVLHGAAGGVRP